MKAEQVLYLCRENRYGDTACESHYDGVGDIFDDCSEPEQSEEDEEETRHERRDGESLKAILLYDAVYYNNERARRTANLHTAASECRHYESRYDGCDDALLRSHARCDAESDSQRQCDDAYDDAGHDVGC